MAQRTEISMAADRLRLAAASKLACAPVRDLLGPSSIAEAYAVQELNRGRELAAGARIAGWKIGLTSEAVRGQLGVDQPDFGALYEDRGRVDGARLELAELLQPRIEAEVGFVLGDELPEGRIGPAEVLAATEAVLAVLEIPESRIVGWDISISDTVADNASAGYFVTGSLRMDPADLDLVDLSMSLLCEGELISSGSGSASMGDPAVAVAWLANALRALGQELRPGDLILSGALGAMIPVEAPGRYRAELSGLGSVSVEFVDSSR
jgi:2-keto-4-pentenoate hydratase